MKKRYGIVSNLFQFVFMGAFVFFYAWISHKVLMMILMFIGFQIFFLVSYFTVIVIDGSVIRLYGVLLIRKINNIIQISDVNKVVIDLHVVNPSHTVVDFYSKDGIVFKSIKTQLTKSERRSLTKYFRSKGIEAESYKGIYEEDFYE